MFGVAVGDGDAYYGPFGTAAGDDATGDGNEDPVAVRDADLEKELEAMQDRRREDFEEDAEAGWDHDAERDVEHGDDGEGHSQRSDEVYDRMMANAMTSDNSDLQSQAHDSVVPQFDEATRRSLVMNRGLDTHDEEEEVCESSVSDVDIENGEAHAAAADGNGASKILPLGPTPSSPTRPEGSGSTPWAPTTSGTWTSC